VSYLEPNLEALAIRQPDLATWLQHVELKTLEIFPSVAGFPTVRFGQGENTLHLHSRYDPAKEARKLLTRPDPAANYFVLLGFGLGYPLDALIERDPDPNNSYFIVESNLEILRAAFEARDLRGILTLPYIRFAWPVTQPEVAKQWMEFFDPVRAQNTSFISHPSSVALNPGLFKAAAAAIQSQTFQIFTDINTLVGRSQTFLDNFVQNLHVALSAPGVAGFTGRFEGVPAILVSAGPSLDKNIHELRSCEDRALILATDTTMKPLLAAGIVPHFVLTGDPGHENYLHLKGTGTCASLLVAEGTAYPASLAEFSERTILCTFENSALPSLSDLLAHKGTLRAWGSVATMGLDFALRLGCNPIIFVGQDLAHSHGRTYCSGVHFEERWFAGITNPDQWEECAKRLRTRPHTVVVQDIFGSSVESTDKLTGYWNWFTKELHAHVGVRFINATEGGILKENVDIISLREALHRYCSTRRNLRGVAESTYTEIKNSGMNPAHSNKSLAALTAEFDVVERLVASGIESCECSSGTNSGEMCSQLRAIKDSIILNTRIVHLLDCFNQVGNLTFLRRSAALNLERISSGLSPAFQAIYSDYFRSIESALSRIRPAIEQIELILTKSTVPETSECR